MVVWGGRDYGLAPLDTGGVLSLAPSGFHPVTPCRAADTRGPEGFLGGPALGAATVRIFPVRDVCGISARANAISFTLTVTEPSAAGHLVVYPEGCPLPAASTVNFGAGQTRAVSGIVALGGGIAVRYAAATAATTHVVLDVSGYFE
jgi:hypothetical protein